MLVWIQLINNHSKEDGQFYGWMWLKDWSNGENPQEIREFLPPAYNEIQISCFRNK